MKKKYLNYKDSGVEWIGEIPEFWEVVPFRTLIKSVKNGYSGTQVEAETEYKVSRIESISFGKIDFSKVGFVEETKRLDDYKLNKGDLLFSNINSLAMVGNTAIYEEEKKLYAGMNLLRIQPADKVNSKFLYYLIVSHYFNQFVKSMAKHAINQVSIPTNKIKSIPSILIPLEEQEKISKYLDVKIARLDSLIYEKSNLIVLLEEKRQAIITEAVTKGLNSNVKMKDSGVEWIGEIPEHWDITKIKYCLESNPNKSEINLAKNEEATFVPMENIIETGVLDTSLEKKIEDMYNGYTYFANEDILMAKVTPCFENGNITVATDLKNGIGFGTTELHILRAKSNQNNKFYYYLIQSARFMQEGVSTMYGVGGLKRIPLEFVENFKFAKPLLAEQDEIVDYLEGQVKGIATLKSEVALQIQKLKEYRQSLIYEAVTGKIDVRDFEIE